MLPTIVTGNLLPRDTWIRVVASGELGLLLRSWGPAGSPRLLSTSGVGMGGGMGGGVAGIAGRAQQPELGLGYECTIVDYLQLGDDSMPVLRYPSTAGKQRGAAGMVGTNAFRAFEEGPKEVEFQCQS